MNVISKTLAIFVVIYLCGSTNVIGQAKEVPKPMSTPNSSEVVKTEVKTEVNPYKNKSNEKYRIGFQDRISVQVFRHPELSSEMNVNPDGTIMMPRIDQPIIAVCKTEKELADAITSQYKSYLKAPFVTVLAVEQKSQPFAVVGAVEKPGSFYLNRKVRLLELLAFAGGQDVETAGSKVQVARVGNITGCTEEVNEDDKIEFVSYNLKDVLEGKENPWMQPGDIVSVLIAEEAYVVGNVGKPSKVLLNEPRTLTQALAIAGGINSTAKTKKVIIQRQEKSGNKVELAFDLKDIRDRKIPDPQLQANDIVQVDTDTTKSLMKGIRGIFTNSIPSALIRFP